MIKFNKEIPVKYFIASQIIILLTGIIVLGWAHYILNIKDQPVNQIVFGRGPITSAPKTLRIDLSQPDDNILTFNEDIIISGKTSPNMEVLILTQSKDFIIKSKSDGSFSTVLKLDEGVNNITAVVFDSTGDSRSSERMVYYSKEKI